MTGDKPNSTALRTLSIPRSEEATYSKHRVSYPAFIPHFLSLKPGFCAQMGLMEIQSHPRSRVDQLFGGNPFPLLAVGLGTDSSPNFIQLCCDACQGTPEKGFVIPRWLLTPQRCSQETRACHLSILLPIFEELTTTSEALLNPGSSIM